MKASLENRILLRCPIIYRGRHLSPKHNLMCFGFECGGGWFQIIYDLSVSIENHAEKLKANGVSDDLLPCVTQVKEKFGGLRFYVDNLYGDMCELIDAAEALSQQTCDVCGAPANRQYINDWLLTICDTCANKHTGDNGSHR